MNKYEITNIQHPNNKKLFRIRALRDISRFDVKAGDLGGYIENKGNLSQEGDCWVGDNACVYGKADVFENAHIYGNASVYNGTNVSGNAQIYDNAQVGGAWILGKAHVNMGMSISSKYYYCMISSIDQIYYSDGVTAWVDICGVLTTICTNSSMTMADIEHHTTIARLKLL